MPPRTAFAFRLLALALSLGALSLHVREVVRTGLWQPPVFAVPGDGPDAYPVVGGNTLEVQGAPHALEPGDVLLQLGSVDLRGEGYLGFMGVAHEQANPTGRAPLVFERDGERAETQLELAPFAVPWGRVPFLVGMWLLVAYLTWRRPYDPVVATTTAAFCAVIVGEAIFDGGGRIQTTVGKLLFIFGGAVWWPLVIRWIPQFPAPVPTSSSTGIRLAMIASGFLWCAPKLQYLAGGPTPPPLIPLVVSAADAAGVVLGFGMLAFNYSGADEARRRSLRWVFFSTFFVGVFMVVALTLPVLVPFSQDFPLAMGIAAISAVAIPAGFLVSMTAYDLFDIDRLISATASYSMMLVAFLAVLLTLVPPVAATAAPAFGLDPETGRLVLSVLAAALVVPASQWMRPRIDGWFFPERLRVEEGMDALIAEQSRERSAEGVAYLLAERLGEVFAPAFSAAYVREGDAYLAVAAAPVAPLDRLAGDDPLLAELGAATRPLVLDPRQQVGLRVSSPAALAPALVDAEAALLLPVRQGRAVEALVLLGRKRSGDVYTGSELTLLRASLEAARRQLEGAREREARVQERDRAESIEAERRRVEAAHLARSQQLAAASHDLRQPLHAIRLSAEALGDRIPGDEDRAIVERIQSSAASLHEMFDSLIDLARMEQGSLAVTIAPVAVAPMLERLAAEAEPDAVAKGLELVCEPCDAWVQSDLILLSRIVQNLLVNAIRYTPAGRVTLRAAADSDEVVLSVADTGPGIPREMQEEVFGEFVRLDAPSGDRGLGLGLSIVQRLGERLGHRVSLDSEPGRGSRFSVAAPRAEAPARAPTAAAAPALGGLAGRCVLVVDDDIDVLASVRALLEGWGVEVRLAKDTEEAAEAVVDDLDAIVADFRLADEAKGTAVIAALRARAGREIPALVVTGSTSSEILDEVQATGLPYLSKPVAPARLRAALAAAFAPPAEAKR